MIHLVQDISTLVGLGSSSIGIMGVISAAEERTRLMSAAVVAIGVATVVASRIWMDGQ